MAEPGLKKFVHWLLAAVFVAPLFVNSRFFFPFITTKTLYVRLLIEVAAFLYLLVIIRYPAYRPRRSLLWWTGGAYLVVVITTSIFGVNPERSFWGNVERGEGVLMLLHLALFVVMLASLNRREKDWWRVMEVSVGAAVLITLLAFAQAAGAFFVASSTTGSRFSSTVGNPSFFAAYLLFQLAFLAYLFIRRSELWRRIMYGAAWLMLFAALLGTATRGAILAFGVVSVALLFCALFKAPRRSVRYGALGVLAGLAILTGIVWASREELWVRENAVLRRLVSISAADITTQSRLAAWRASWAGWQERLLFGWGYENYNIPFNKHFPTAIYRDEGSQIWFDRAHNIVFDAGTTSGLTGLAAYVAMFAAAAFTLRRVARANPADRWLALIIGGLLAAYLLQNLFVFDTLASYLPFMLVLAWLARRDMDLRSAPDRPPRRIPGWLGGAAGVVLVTALIVFVFRPAAANLTLTTAIKAGQANVVGSATALFEEVLGYGDYQRFETRSQFAQFAGGVPKGAPDRRHAIEAAITAMEASVREVPNDAQYRLQLMELLNIGAEFDPARYERAVALGEEMRRLSPTRPHVYYAMAQARIAQGRGVEGAELIERAVALAPHVGEAHWNLGAAYAFAGDLGRMQAEFQLAQELGFTLHSPARLNRYLFVLSQIKDYRGMAEILEKYLALTSVTAADSTAWARLAAVLKEIGEFEKAEQALSRALELEPRLREDAERFLEAIKASSTAAKK